MVKLKVSCLLTRMEIQVNVSLGIRMDGHSLVQLLSFFVLFICLFVCLFLFVYLLACALGFVLFICLLVRLFLFVSDLLIYTGMQKC